MTVTVTHTFISTISDGSNPALVQPSNWNATHTLAQTPGTVAGAVAGGSGQTVELPLSFSSSGDAVFETTGSVTLAVGSTGQRPGSPADGMVRFNNTLHIEEYYDATATLWQAIASQAWVTTFVTGQLAPIRSYLAGLTLSTAGMTTTFGIAAGVCADTTTTAMMNLPAFTKNSGAWVAGSGNGSLDGGAVGANTWYHVYVIENLTGPVIDVIISTSPSTPTLPAGYTLFRRIGSLKTDGSNNFIAFVQDGDLFEWLTPVQDASVSNPGTSAILQTLASAPLGVVTQAILLVYYITFTAFGGQGLYISDPAVADLSPNGGTSPGVDVTSLSQSSGNANPLLKTVRTNASAQIRIRATTSGSSDLVDVVTRGWIDSRGRNA